MALTAQSSDAFLDAFSQPAVVLEQGRICAMNQSARQQLGDPEALAAALIGCLDREDPELTLQGRAWRLRTALQDGQTLVVFRELDRLSLDELGVIARTLRQPLTDIFNSTGPLFAMLENLDDPEVQTLTAQLNRGQYQLLRIANSLTVAGDYLNGTAQLNLGRVDLKAMMQTLELELSGLVEAAGLHLEVLGPANYTNVYLDQVRVRQALMYLVSNAIKYAAPGSVLRLEAQADLSHVTFRCINRGEPMDPTVMAWLEDLTRLQGGVGDPRWGLGLGLRLAWAIARLHGGTLLAQSGPEGETRLLLRLDRLRRPLEQNLLRSPAFDLTGGYDSMLIELSDVLPPSVYDTVDVH